MAFRFEADMYSVSFSGHTATHFRQFEILTKNELVQPVEIFGQKSKRADPAAKSSFEQQAGRQGRQQDDQPGRVHRVENPADQPVLKAD